MRSFKRWNFNLAVVINVLSLYKGGGVIFYRKRTGGFTLIELIVVLVIIGIISGVVMVRYTSSLDSIRFRKTMTELVFSLRESRIKAMATGEPVNVIFDLHGGFCWDNDRKVFKLYPEIEIFTDKIDAREEPTRTIVFYPGGMASEEKLGFVCDKMVIVLHVEPLGGLAYYKVGEEMEEAYRYARIGGILSDEEILERVDAYEALDKNLYGLLVKDTRKTEAMSFNKGGDVESKNYVEEVPVLNEEEEAGEEE